MKLRITVLLLFIATVAHAQNSTNSYTLPTYLEMVLENAYSIKFAHNNEEILNNNATRGNAGMLPKVNATAGFGGSLNQLQSSGGNDYTNTHNENYNIGVNGSWTLFDGWGMQASYDRLQEIKKNGELATKLQVETSIAEATTMYYELIQRQQKLKNLETTLSLSRERLRLAREKYLVGSRSQLELLQAQVDFNADSSAYVTYMQGVRDLQINFKKLLVLPFDDNDIIVTDTSFRLNEQLKLEELMQLATEKNTSLKIYSTNRTITDFERKQIAAARYPYINLNASYGYSGNQYSYNSSQSNSLGLGYGINLGWKIYDGANQRRQEANIKITQMNSELQYEQQLQQVMADLHLLYSSYDTYVHLLELERGNRAIADKKIGLAMELYSLGQITSLELREHQKTSLDAQDRLVNAIYQAKLSEIYLMQLCGVVLDYLNIKPID